MLRLLFLSSFGRMLLGLGEVFHLLSVIIRKEAKNESKETL